MVNTNKTDKIEKVGITLQNLLLKQVDKMRTEVPRSMFIRRAIEQFLRKEG